MDEFVPKSPTTPAKAGAGAVRADGAAVALPQRSRSKPTGRKPAPVRTAQPVAAPLSVAPAAVEPVAPIVPPAAKEATMETIENVTATTQTAFTEATDRAKGAVDKSQKLLQDASEFGKGNIEAIVESSKIAAKGAETLGHEVSAYAKASFEGATEAMKTLAAAKSPTEFMKLQGDYMRTAFDTLIADSARSTEMMMKMAGEITQPLSNRVAIATEKMKIAN